MTMLKPALVLAAALAFAVAPFITPPFTGYEPGRFPVPVADPAIQPAGYAFAIWSVIYLWLLAHAGFGLFRRAEDPGWDRMRWPLIVSLAVGAGWLAVAPDWPILATVMIWVMLATALAAFLLAPPATDRWLLAAPMAIYAGWLTAASGVSLGVVLSGYGWLGDTQGAVAMLALVLAIAVWVQRARPTMPVYGLTVIWALAGIVVENGSANLTVSLIAASGIAVMAITLLGARRA